MFPFQISSSFFDPEILIPEMSSSSSASAESPSICSDSDSSISTTSSTSSEYYSAVSSSSGFFNPSTCQYQNFSIPEKIVYYIAKNVTNPTTFQKLVQTCKYFFTINPVIVVHKMRCWKDIWYVCYDEDREYKMKCDLPINFKIWVTQKFACVSGNAPQMIPWIYKNDATVVVLQSEPLTFEIFLFLAGNAKELSMYEQMIKYESGEIVHLEDVVKYLPKLKSLTLEFVESGVNSNTVKKLLEIEHFKNISNLTLYNVSEALDAEGMFKYIWENKQIEVDLFYRHDIPDAYKQLIQQYSNLLEKELGCKSVIKYDRMNYVNIHETSSSEDDSSEISYESVDEENLISFVYENDDLLFPWNNEENEEWELPWNKE